MVQKPLKPWHRLNRTERMKEISRMLEQPATRKYAHEILLAVIAIEQDKKVQAFLKRAWVEAVRESFRTATSA